MSSVLGNRHVVQLCLLATLGLAVAACWGCNGSVDEEPAPGVTAAPSDVAPQPAEDVPTEDVPAEDTPAEDVPAEDTPVEDVPAEATPTEDTPVEDTPVEDAPAEDMPTEDTPAEDAPAEDAPAEDTPAEDTPAELPPFEVTPAEDTSADVVYDPAIIEPSVEDAPAEDAPAEDIPAEDTPAEDDANPTGVPTVTWLPAPIEVADAAADDEAGMKAYTEELPHCDVTFKMVPIPGGKFTMGSPDGEADRNDDEGPQHEVAIAPFWMGMHEVTWDEFELWGLSLDKQRREILGVESTERTELVDAIAMPTKPYSDMTFGMGKDGYPAICMSQLAARTYCKWLSAKTGRYYRLPTEAEWEYACRAGTTTAYSFGDDLGDLDDYAWHFENSDDSYQKVGKKKPNPWGLYDMHGNVSEWVTDQYVADFYKQFADKPADNPLAPASVLFPRVVRGGCWDDDPDKLRSAARTASDKLWRSQDPQLPKSIWYLTEVSCPGMRVVRPLTTPDAEAARAYEPDYEAIKEHREAQAGKE